MTYSNRIQRNSILENLWYTGLLLILFFPLMHVSARICITEAQRDKVIFGIITSIDRDTGSFILVSSSTTVKALYSSTTELYTGNEERISLLLLDIETPLYIFGQQGNATTTYENKSISIMTIEKIVIRNKSKLTRK